MFPTLSKYVNLACHCMTCAKESNPVSWSSSCEQTSTRFFAPPRWHCRSCYRLAEIGITPCPARLKWTKCMSDRAAAGGWRKFLRGTAIPCVPVNQSCNWKQPSCKRGAIWPRRRSIPPFTMPMCSRRSSISCATTRNVRRICSSAKASPQMTLSVRLHEAARAEAEKLLLAQDVDLAITVIEKKSRGGIQARPLLELPLILLVYKKSRLACSDELWKRDKIEETLISFPRTDPVHVYFQQVLERLGVEMVLRNRGQLGSLDRTLRRERLRNRFGSGGAGIQTVATSPSSSAASISSSRHRRGLVRETFQYSGAIARRSGNRSASANAPYETQSPPLKRS
jgi:hypothetical protein